MTAKISYVAVLMIFISSVTVASSSVESNVRNNSINAALEYIRENHPNETQGIQDIQFIWSFDFNGENSPYRNIVILEYENATTKLYWEGEVFYYGYKVTELCFEYNNIEQEPDPTTTPTQEPESTLDVKIQITYGNITKTFNPYQISLNTTTGEVHIEEAIYQLFDPIPDPGSVFTVVHNPININQINNIAQTLGEKHQKTAYVFQMTNTPWGQYDKIDNPQELLIGIQELKNQGYRVFLYIDPTECDKRLSSNYPDSILQQGGQNEWWSLMDLDPEKSWASSLRNQISNLLTLYPMIDGFAVDRLDRLNDILQAEYTNILLEYIVEVSDNSEFMFICNSLSDQSLPVLRNRDLKFFMVGSDGCSPTQEHLESWISRYKTYALEADTICTEPYLAPWLEQPDNTNIVPEYQLIWESNSHTFISDWSQNWIPLIWPNLLT